MGAQNGKEERSSLEGRDVRQLDQRVSQMLAKGVKYNMKILIRGERKSGKSQFLRRLQGLPFEREYKATPEICTAHLIWEVPESDGKAVKVEMWDVVDKGIQPDTNWAGVTGEGGQEQENRKGADVVLLDAQTINVYQGCDGMIVCFDPSRRETFEYASKLVKSSACKDIPILIAAGFRDRGEGDAVKESEIEKLIRGHDKACWIRTSLVNDYGMERARKFLMVPFTCMRQNQARRQLTSCGEVMDRQRERLDAHADTLNYEVHCKQWAQGGAQRAMQQAERMQALQKAAAQRKLDEGGTPISPGGTRQKLVPISALIPAPRIDADAPDLGKEVASFNTGMIDEGFFSSDDEVDGQVAVMPQSDDDEDGGNVVTRDDDEPASVQATPDRPRRGGGGREQEKEVEEREGSESEDEEDEEKKVEEAKREERVRAERILEAKRLAEEKAKIEEDKLQSEMEAALGGDGGGLDGFLDSDDDGDDDDDADAGGGVGGGGGGNEKEGGEGWGSMGGWSEDEDEGGEKKMKKAGGDWESDDNEEEDRPHIMGDADLSDSD